MSCMYLSKRHYQFIADSLYRLCTEFQSRPEFHTTRKYFGETCGERSDSILRFVNNLQWQNRAAYLSRYPELTRDDSAPILVKECKALGSDTNAAALLKALECADYQCIDWDGYPATDECKMLRAIVQDCLRHIAYEHEGYKAAPWSIE